MLFSFRNDKVILIERRLLFSLRTFHREVEVEVEVVVVEVEVEGAVTLLLKSSSFAVIIVPRDGPLTFLLSK